MTRVSVAIPCFIAVLCIGTVSATARVSDDETRMVSRMSEHACGSGSYSGIVLTADTRFVPLRRICLPEPCKKALSSTELGDLLESSLDTGTWDYYVTRYA